MIKLLTSGMGRVVVWSLLLLGGPGATSRAQAAGAEGGGAFPVEGGVGQSRQVLLVVGDEAKIPTAAVYALEAGEGGWHRVLGPLNAVVGRNGMAAPGTKREGDGKAPSGLFEMGTTFGYAAETPGRMPYRQATTEDLWVDDAASPDYNRWVRRGESAATSFEELRRKDGLYEFGAVIEYNTKPVVPGNGSAIFLHVWRGADKPTAGCVAVSRDDLLALLKWLDPSAAPRVLMGTRAALGGVVDALRLQSAK